MVYGLMTCQGNNHTKAETLFNLLQDGGLNTHDRITANDKDMLPVFLKLTKMCTFGIFEFA